VEQHEPNAAKVVSLRARKLILWSLLPPLLVGLVGAILVWKFPGLNPSEIPDTTLVWSGLALAGVCLVAVFLVWRCPECRGYLGREGNPERCPHCGVRFTESADRR
jgi:hypothetical protein